jgi:Cd2+/Zn2+-exporting ATPase
VAFDKTGTLTVGKPRVTDVKLLQPSTRLQSQEDLLQLTASVEQKSEHPLAQAIVAAAKDAGLDLDEASEFKAVPGKGIAATLNGSRVQIGNLKFLRDIASIDARPVLDKVTVFQDQGKTSILVAVDGQLVGILALADQLREGVPAIMQALKSQGVEKTLMLTGDHEQIGRQIAAEAGLDDYYADLLPEQKLDIIHKLEQEIGPVAMVGDGVNDAPALAAASLGIAMGAAGTDVALETADIVLMGDDLANIPYLFDLSRATRKTLIQNLVFAMGVIVVLIGGVLGFQLALPLSVIGHEGSTVLVSLNGIRLLGFQRQGEKR